MNWGAAQGQQEYALLRVFYMLVALFLLTIRTERDARIGSSRRLAFSSGRPRAEMPTELAPQPPSPHADFHHEVLKLLCAIHAVGRRLIGMMMRAIYEFMKQAHALARLLVRAQRTVSQCSLPKKRLDSS